MPVYAAPRPARDIAHLGPSCGCVSPEAVHAVVRVLADDEVCVRAEGVRFAHEFQGGGGIRGEYHGVFVWAGVEEGEDAGPGLRSVRRGEGGAATRDMVSALMRRLSSRASPAADGMSVAKDVVAEKERMCVDKAFGVQATPHVIN